jgi:PDZ domain-containing protein
MKVRMIKSLLWSLNGLLTLAILGSVALFVLKSRTARADRLDGLDAIQRDVMSKAKKGPAKSTAGVNDYETIWKLDLRNNPPPPPEPERAAPPKPTTTPLGEVIALRAIVGQTIMVEFKDKKDPVNPAQKVQKQVQVGTDIPDVSPAATLLSIEPAPEPERVKFRYDGKEVVMSIVRTLEASTEKSVGGGPPGKRGKNAPEGKGDIEVEEDQPFPGPSGQVPAIGRVPGSDGPVTETKQIKPGVWQISNDERDKIRDTAKDLLEQADVRTYTNEKTHKNEGMIVDHIQPDSLLLQRGLQEGDVIKSINGTPVSSKTDIINYVKDNQDRLNVVRVVIDRLGKPMTIEYHIPK